MKKFSAILVLLLGNSAAVFAVCGGASPNLVAAGVTRTDVNDCVTAAVTGDTITVPSGTATWATAITLPSTKDLTIIGATVITCSGVPITCGVTNNTSITLTAGQAFTINLAATQRISGFTLLTANSGGIGFTGDAGSGKHFRLDHNRIVSSAGWAPMEILGGSNGVHPYGLVDNNILVDISVQPNGTVNGWDDACGTCQHQLWAQQTPLGDSVAIVYIEDNEFQNTASNVNSSDSNYGGRYVFRFNNITSGRHTVEVHGMQGENRGSQRTEIYKNSASGLTGFSGTTFFRGGAGVVWGNTQSAAFSFGISFTIDRAEYDEPAGTFGTVKECGVGGADGNSPAGVDQQTGGRNGWRCRDQVGIAYDSVQWANSPFGAYAQVASPLYIWLNRTGGSQMAVDVDTTGDVETKILANEEFYDEAASFNGTVGTGVGVIASRPATCTTGVGYWATDEGEWNSRQAGADGLLYKCTSTNTWTLFYTPYTYPHPLQGGGSTVGGTIAPGVRLHPGVRIYQ